MWADEKPAAEKNKGDLILFHRDLVCIISI